MDQKRNFKLLQGLFQLAPPKKYLLVGAVIFIGLASLAQMIGLGLVVPVLNGLTAPEGFRGLEHTPVLGAMIQALPRGTSNEAIFLFLMVFIFASVCLENIALFLGQLLSSKMSMEMVSEIRIRSFARFLQFGKTFFDHQKPGELTTLLTGCASQIGNLIEQLARLVTLVLFAAVFFSLMVVISWQLTLIAALLLPLTQLISRRVSQKIRVSAQEEVQSLMTLSNEAADVFANMPLVHLSGQEEQELARFRGYAEDLKRHGFNVRKKRYASPRLVDIVDSCGVVVVVCISVFYYFFATGTYSAGRFFVYFVSLRRFTSHLEQMSSVFALTSELFVYLQKLLWVFEDTDKPLLEGGQAELSHVRKEIEYSNVTFSYRVGEPVLKDISFTARRGTTTAFVGMTGAGKTTLLSLLPRFYELDSGAICIDGRNIREFRLQNLREKMAFVSQDTFLFNATILKNLVYGVPGVVSKQRLDEALAFSCLDGVISKLPQGLNTEIGTKGTRLSGGEKQRLSLARAILRKPDILVLDEATSALDAETEQSIQRCLEQSSPEQTVFVIAHRYSTVKNADNILFLEHGRVLEKGSFEDLLMRKGRFFEAWELQRLQIQGIEDKA